MPRFEVVTVFLRLKQTERRNDSNANQKTRKDTLLDLGITEVIEATDMNQMVNPDMRNAVLSMRREVQTIPNLKYQKYTWNPKFNGIDDYLQSRAAAG